jgi:hypothetical protein
MYDDNNNNLKNYVKISSIKYSSLPNLNLLKCTSNIDKKDKILQRVNI